MFHLSVDILLNYTQYKQQRQPISANHILHIFVLVYFIYHINFKSSHSHTSQNCSFRVFLTFSFCAVITSKYAQSVDQYEEHQARVQDSQTKPVAMQKLQTRCRNLPPLTCYYNCNVHALSNSMTSSTRRAARVECFSRSKVTTNQPRLSGLFSLLSSYEAENMRFV